MKAFARTTGLIIILAAVGFACAGRHKPLDTFVERQKSKMVEKSAFQQADFDFWAAMLEPTVDDLEGIRHAWVEHGQAFPESKPFTELEREVHKSAQKVVLVALFMTAYEKADLKDQSLGWGVYPVPSKITELSENDAVIRTLMPVRNQWARYFLLRYAPDVLNAAPQVVVSNSSSRVELRRGRY